MTNYRQFEPLEKKIHDRNSFDCGITELNDFLQKFASVHQEKGISKTFVLPKSEDRSFISAFYALTHGDIDRSEFPAKIEKKLPYYPIPIVLIAQLGVDRSMQGRGIGSACVTSALTRIYKTNAQLPSFAVVVDAIDDNAQRFYERFTFAPLGSKRQRTRMFIPMNTVSKLII